VREIREELGIQILDARPLIRVRHRYPEHEVLLDVWRIERFAGQPRGCEGQELRWVKAQELADYPLPDANRPIVSAATLPALYLITPEPGPDHRTFLAHLSRRCAEGIELVQLRTKGLTGPGFDALAREAISTCHASGARLVVNTTPEKALELGADGVHLTHRRLMGLSIRPVPSGVLLGASCHDIESIEQAARIEADFIVISPVLATASHPGARATGWEGLRVLTEQARMPAYALGGLGKEHLPLAWQHGGQGIAAIRSLWG
jgi:8-oxo-dGTP diphosphatase